MRNLIPCRSYCAVKNCLKLNGYDRFFEARITEKQVVDGFLAQASRRLVRSKTECSLDSRNMETDISPTHAEIHGIENLRNTGMEWTGTELLSLGSIAFRSVVAKHLKRQRGLATPWWA